MTWLPDWNLPRKTYELVSDLNRFESFSSGIVEVVEEGEDLYRLYDFHYSPALRWGDLIRGKAYGDKIEIIKRVERAEHTFTDGTGVTDKPHAGLVLDAILQAGGFWAADSLFALRGIDLAIPPGFDRDQWVKENHDWILSFDHQPTAWDKFIQGI